MIFVMKYFYELVSILLGIMVSALAFHAEGPGSIPQLGKLQINFFSFFSFCPHQTFLNKLATFNNHLKLSPLKKLLSQKGCQL
jgi:hypothetical protein